MRAVNAGDSLLAVSGGGAYAEQARRHARVLGKQDGPFLSEASVIVKDILHAATAARPKTRYPSGAGAAMILGLRRLLPDRAFDVVLEQVFARMAK